MKNIIFNRFYGFGALLLSVLAVSCAKDNYPEPGTMLSGKIVYQGEAVPVEYNQVRLQLWEPGWGKLAAIDVPIAPDGSYSALLFNGNYKLVIPSGQGPFMTNVADAVKMDTIFVQLKGNTNLDIEVKPYYLIRNAKFIKHENSIQADFKLDKIITDASAKNVERVTFYINKTAIVSGSDNIQNITVQGEDIENLNQISMALSIPSVSPVQNFVFARIGVKIAGVEDLVFSQVEKVTW